MAEHFPAIKSIDDLSKKFSAATLEFAAARAARAEANAMANIPMKTHIPSATLTELESPPYMATHIPAPLAQPKKFIPSSLSHYVSQPVKYRPNYDTLGDFAGQPAREGPCVRVVYKRNGVNVVYPDAYWTPLYPYFVAAGTAHAAQKLKEDGFNVLDVELSHDARCHYGGPQPRCDLMAQEYTPCANMHNNAVMQEQYGANVLARNYQHYKNRRNKIDLEDRIMQRQIDAQNRAIYGVLTSSNIGEVNVSEFRGYSINDGVHGTLARAMARCNGPSIADVLKSL